MPQQLVQLAIVVKDYDEAIRFYREKLGFELLEDTTLSETKRWVVMCPPGGHKGCRILLAKAANEKQEQAIGNQTGGRVFLFLHTTHIDQDYERLKANGVTIVRQPEDQDFGRVLVFADLYGNLWDLIQPFATQHN